MSLPFRFKRFCLINNMVQFGSVDYAVLVTILAVSLGIGIYFGRKRQSSREYTSAKGQMGILPVSLSLTVSFISAITVQVSVLHLCHNSVQVSVLYLCNHRSGISTSSLPSHHRSGISTSSLPSPFRYQYFTSTITVQKSAFHFHHHCAGISALLPPV